MNEEIIVAVYDTHVHADAAVRDLEAAHVPPDAISRDTGTGSASGSAVSSPNPVGGQGFWTSIGRRPASTGTRVDDADFTDRTIEVSETEEEAVIGNTPAGGTAPSMLPPALPRLFKDSVFRSSNAAGRVKANLSLCEPQ